MHMHMKRQLLNIHSLSIQKMLINSLGICLKLDNQASGKGTGKALSMVTNTKYLFTPSQIFIYLQKKLVLEEKKCSAGIGPNTSSKI